MWSVHSLWPCCFVLSWLCRSRVVKWRCCLPCARSLSLSLSLSLSFSLSLSVSLFLPPPSFPSLPVSLNQDTACPFLCIAACLPSALLLYLSCTLSLALSAMRFQPLSVCRSPLYSPVTGLQHKQLRLQAFPLLFWTFITCVLSLVCVSNRTSFFNWVLFLCLFAKTGLLPQRTQGSARGHVTVRWKGRRESRRDEKAIQVKEVSHHHKVPHLDAAEALLCVHFGALSSPLTWACACACALGLGSGYISPWQSINPFACSSIPAPPARHFTF